MVENIKKITITKMDNCITLFKHHLSTLCITRASPSILNSIYINYFGKKVQLCKVSSIAIENFNTLKINLFDISLKNDVEKAIKNSELNLNPISIGSAIKIVLPILTEERRKHYIKLAKSVAEQGRVCVRNIRRNANDRIKCILKDKLISHDIERRLQHDIQNITNNFIKKINQILEKKEQDLINI
ncbi:MAG: ribosome recycling factor [Buchnera aphidicola (Kaburagia rhusicola rhusicola)]